MDTLTNGKKDHCLADQEHHIIPTDPLTSPLVDKVNNPEDISSTCKTYPSSSVTNDSKNPDDDDKEQCRSEISIENLKNIKVNGEDNHLSQLTGSIMGNNGTDDQVNFPDKDLDKFDTTLVEASLRESNLFNSSGLNVTVIDTTDTKTRGDGSDSGVESTSMFQRAFSYNSAGYSSGGFDDFNKSCESSLLSYSEDTELMTTSLTLYAGDGTSEAGSESSLGLEVETRAKPTLFQRTTGNVKKKTTTKSSKDVPSGNAKVQPVTPTSRRRQNMTPVKSPVPNVIPKSTPNKREKQAGPHSHSENTATKETTPFSRTAARSKLSKANTGIKGEMRSRDSPQRDASSKTDSGLKPKASSKTTVGASARPKTPRMDDGRWPSTNKSPVTPKPRRGATEMRKLTEVTKVSNCEGKSPAFDKFGTFPRRSRRKSPEPPRELTRSISVNRDQVVRRVHRNVRELGTSLPPYPRRRVQKTRIYHEISIQTALTNLDIEKALEGIFIKEPSLVCVEKLDQEVQVDREKENNQGLEFEYRKLREENENLKQKINHHKDELHTLKECLSDEKAANEKTRDELKRTELRLLSILGKCDGDNVEDNLQEIETSFLSFSNNSVLQQREIAHLQAIGRRLQCELEKSLAERRIILQQQRDSEMESVEMQEFLQAEKAMLAEALRDAETEAMHQKQFSLLKETELERKQEECKHLVRISEQRRQENLLLQARLGGLEQKSKDLLLQQGASVSGAAVALSGLSSRLDGLVEQLVTSYDISETDLEDVIFHNEAYTTSNSSSAEASPERITFHQPMPSPKRRASFLTAVVKAIRNATNQTSSVNNSRDGDKTPTDENTLHIDSSYPPVDDREDDSSSKSPRHSRLANSESLHNLSQAILNRQRLEDESEDIDSITCDGSDNEVLPELGDYTLGFTFVDQIIDVDNLVTKLLKVLRIIQLENDTTVDMLQEDRVKLEEEVRKEQDLRRATQDDVRNWELLGARLRGEVQEAKLQLQRKVVQLEETRADLQAHREQVRMLNSEITSLSVAQKQLQHCENEAKSVLEKWQQTGELPSPDSISWIITAREEIPALKKQLAEKEHHLLEIEHKYSANNQLLTQNLHQAANEIRRQYEAVDNALEVLHSIQSLVVQCPPLAKLQRELEETNFHCASTLPIVAADLNANAAMMISNGIHNSSLELSQAVL